jgi:exodeoxyribonuclease VII large subunit
MQSDVLTVTEYSARLGRALRAVGGAVIEGEVQKPKSSGSGMLWFSLTDGDGVLSCKVFRGQVGGLEHVPREGDLVQVEVERPDLWPQAGKLDLIVSQVRLAGEGELLRRRQELIERLTSEGLCDSTRWRALPRFPRAVGVIAGEGSDAMSDVVRALIDRWPGVHVVTCSAPVQGKGAPRKIIDALARMEEHPSVDVVVLARGGGSVQDLACFDDEGLCRALFACRIAVVCAIGHTDNNPVCNSVAWPAYTPSRSAELVVPSAAELRRDIAGARICLDEVPSRLALAGERLERVGERLDCTTALSAHAGLIRERDGEVQGALEGFLISSARGVEGAGRTLAVLPHRAARKLAAEREELLAVIAALGGSEERLTRLARDVRELGAQVRVGTLRQADDHKRDYDRALNRLLREARTGVERRAARVRELVDREGSLLGERARRRLDCAQRDATHAGALIVAHDFRRHGWLLASTESGVSVRSSAELSTGQRIDLSLHDGRVKAVVENINLETENNAISGRDAI